VGTDAALTAWRDGARVSISGDDELLEQPVSAMTPVDNHAAVIAAGLHGFVRGERDQIRGLPTYPPVPTAVRSLFQDAHGWLYLGTRDHGLYVDDGRTLMHLSLRQGLYDDDILGIADDHGGRLWMACSKGVFSVGHESLARFAAGTEDAVETTPLSPLESLRTVECQGDVQPAVTTTRDGRVWFSTSRGVLVVDPNHWRRQLPPTDVVIEEVTVNGRTELPGRPLELPAGVANLAFRYTALSYTSPSRITFRYRLEGFDPEWIEAGTRREAFYTNLPPGRYRFRVAATNADDKRYEASAPVDITIPPSLSETAWFMPLCGGLAAFGAWSIYRWRMRQMKQRMQIVVAERSRIARELHDTLMQGFSGITMEMQALSSRLQNPSDRKELEGIIGDAGTCLREARESIAGLRGAHTGLAEAVRQAATQIAETRDFQLDLHVDLDGTRLSPQVEYHLLRITQEALANAAKHAHARRIAVTLGRRADQVRLIVRDDGVGLAGLADGPASTGHYGLIGMRERANQIGATFHLETQPDRGLAVCVTLPLVAGGTEAHAR
jgi:signal transduction histidine kinase